MLQFYFLKLLCFFVSLNFIKCYKLEIYANNSYVSKFYTAKIKDSVKLTCKFFGQNEFNDSICSFEWKKPKNSLQNNYNRIRPNFEYHGTTLDMLSLQRTDSGHYECRCKELNLTTKIILNVKDPLSISYCGPSMFVCEKTEKCIAQRYVCDGKADCKHAEDEHVNKCGTDPCNGKIRNCRDGRCIPANWCCNTELDPNCTIKERPSCCRQQFKLIQEPMPGYSEYHSIKHGLLKAAIFTLFVGAVLFFFLISICLLVLCRIHIHSCPANQDIRQVCSRRRIPFYDFYLFLNRNRNHCDQFCVSRHRTCRTRRNNLIRTHQLNENTNNWHSVPQGVLLMSYNQVHYTPPPISLSPPSYSEICGNSQSDDPPPPYVSRENLTVSVIEENENAPNRNGYVLTATQSDDETAPTTNCDTSCTETVNAQTESVTLPIEESTRRLNLKQLREEFLLGASSSSTSWSRHIPKSNSVRSKRNFRMKPRHSVRLNDNLKEKLRKSKIEDTRSNSQQHLQTNSDVQVPLIKCISDNVHSNSNQNLELGCMSLSNNKRDNNILCNRHSIADLSPSSSSNQHCFIVPKYDKEISSLTLPLQENFINLRKD